VKILLLNDNPVVTKLVTLSAQKTSDELEIVESIDEIEADRYDLFAIDDALYTKELMDEINVKIKYVKSLYICSKDAQEGGEFTDVLKKPFLPTDLVEMLSSIAQDVQESGGIDEMQEIKGDEVQEEFEDDLELNLDELDLDSEDELNDELDLDLDLENLDLEDSLEDELSLDEEIKEDELDDLSLDDFGDVEDIEDSSEVQSVLDKDELQEVQELLDETDEEVEVDAENLEDEDLSLEDEELSLDDEELSLDDEEDLSLEEVDAQVDADEEVEVDAQEDDLQDIEDEIQSAVSQLSEEDLQSEVDADMLEDVALDGIAGLDSLTQKDIKLAIGEEVLDDEEQEEEVDADIEVSQESSSSSNGVDVLKKLLEVLSDEDIAASLNGKKIEINITIGDK
jgi:uncharacterized membrane protein